mmetsp:Transcript_1868/g.4882  ORF Transcript_1868/g.4882 Transcript_1868/m.4882 type:complete len:279 (+) Transcript_1868:953-1789(+)
MAAALEDPGTLLLDGLVRRPRCRATDIGAFLVQCNQDSRYQQEQGLPENLVQAPATAFVHVHHQAPPACARIFLQLLLLLLCADGAPMMRRSLLPRLRLRLRGLRRVRGVVFGDDFRPDDRLLVPEGFQNGLDAGHHHQLPVMEDYCGWRRGSMLMLMLIMLLPPATPLIRALSSRIALVRVFACGVESLFRRGTGSSSSSSSSRRTRTRRRRSGRMGHSGSGGFTGRCRCRYRGDAEATQCGYGQTGIGDGTGEVWAAHVAAAASCARENRLCCSEV